MFWLLTIFLFFPLIALAVNRDVKISNQIGLLALFLLLLIFGFNNGNHDYKPYVEIFNDPEGYAEFGYVLLVEFVKFIGGGHSTLVLIVGGFLTLSLLRAAISFKVNISILCILYFIYPFIFDITQIRNTIMFCFALNGMVYAYEERWIRSFLFILLGACFHNFGLIYILVIFIYKFYSRDLIKIFLLGLVLMVVLPFALSYVFPLINIGRLNSLLYSYLSDTIKLKSILIWGLDYFLFIFVAYNLRKHILIQPSLLCGDFKKIDFLFKILIIHVVFLGFLMYFFEFNRVYRNAFILRYLFVGVCFPYISLNFRLLVVIYIFLNSLFFSYLSSINLEGSYDYFDILTSNYLLDLF